MNKYKFQARVPNLPADVQGRNRPRGRAGGEGGGREPAGPAQARAVSLLIPRTFPRVSIVTSEFPLLSLPRPRGPLARSRDAEEPWGWGAKATTSSLLPGASEEVGVSVRAEWARVPRVRAGGTYTSEAGVCSGTWSPRSGPAGRT